MKSARLRVGSLFSGVGGLDLAVEQFFDAETVWHCEFAPEPSKVLAARWPGVPNFGDVTAVKWTPDCPVCGEPTALYWRDQAARGADEREYHCTTDGWFPLSIRFRDPDAARIPDPVDILCGGFPCQDLSLAGRRSGMRPGTRSGLWSDFVKAIDALRPKVVVIENVRGLLSGCAESVSDSELGSCPRCLDPDGGASHSPNVRALGRVLGDLSNLGFDAEWHGLLASDIGAPHGRFRVFVLAYTRGVRLGAGWDSASRQAASRGASTLTRGCGRTPLSLLPTPDASNANDGEQLDTWTARRDRVKLTAKNGNGMGMPLAIASLTLLPTPRASRGASSTETMYALGAERDDTGDRQGNVTGVVTWGKYAPAVRRWEALTRPAPAPTRPDGLNGRDRLNAELPEWMMGYPAGWVTQIIEREHAIKACGNGVLPHQAFAALSITWGRAQEWIGQPA